MHKVDDRLKKVLIFIEDGSYTFDNRVIREVSALEEDGWDVTVISQKYPGDRFYNKINEKVRAYHYPKPTAESDVGHIFEHAVSLVFGSVLTLWVSVRHGFQVFQACNPMDILWIIALPYKLIGKKFVFDQHDLCPELYLSRGGGGEHGLLYKVIKGLEGMTYRCADVVVATNESYKDIAVKRGAKRPSDIFVVRNGPDLKKFRKVSPNAQFKKPGEVLVGYLGNMNPQDGVVYLLDAASLIIKKHGRVDVKFIFIGGGSSQKELVESARKMELGGHVSFTGRIPDEEMLAALSACDMCVQPDPYNPLNNVSTMNKVLEYMALEMPVIAFDLKETRVSCGDAALYVEPNDISQLAEKIMFLADNHEIRRKMGKVGRQRIEDKLSWKYSIPNLIGAYEHALSGK